LAFGRAISSQGAFDRGVDTSCGEESCPPGAVLPEPAWTCSATAGSACTSSARGVTCTAARKCAGMVSISLCCPATCAHVLLSGGMCK
jgi:hypothetical protein